MQNLESSELLPTFADKTTIAQVGSVLPTELFLQHNRNGNPRPTAGAPELYPNRGRAWPIAPQAMRGRRCG
jgi:hypothetical protein